MDPLDSLLTTQMVPPTWLTRMVSALLVPLTSSRPLENSLDEAGTSRVSSASRPRRARRAAEVREEVVARFFDMTWSPAGTGLVELLLVRWSAAHPDKRGARAGSATPQKK